jgi:hypothetical protein
MAVLATATQSSCSSRIAKQVQEPSVNQGQQQQLQQVLVAR